MPNTKLPRWLDFILDSEAAFKIVGFIFFFILFIATFGVFKLIDDDPQTFRDLGVLVAVLCGLASAILAQVTLNKLGATDELFEGDRRMKMYLYGGFGAAILLALILSIYNHNGTVQQRKDQAISQAEREAAGRFERDPGTQKAIELLNRRREQKATQPASKPAR